MPRLCYSCVVLYCTVILLGSFHFPEKKHGIIHFSGYDWVVKGDEGRVGPGPNYFSSEKRNVWVDDQGRLHLKIISENGKWKCAEVLCKKPLGHGAYTFKVEGRLDQLDRNIVFGLFTWDSDPAYAHREMDIEVSAWGKGAGTRLSFSVQPSATIHIPWSQEGTHTAHALKWEPDTIRFASYHGHTKSLGPVEAEHFYPLSIPAGSDTRVHINLWLYNGKAPANGNEAEVIIKSFEFIPYK
jgi:hypothetical protein